MSMGVEGRLIPQWDLADRMAKSLRTAGIGVQEMADYLDVHRDAGHPAAASSARGSASDAIFRAIF